MKTRRTGTWCVMVVIGAVPGALAACGGSGTAVTLDGGGTSTDTGSRADTGHVGADATPHDTGTTRDVITGHDSGQDAGHDAGQTVEAGPPKESGPPPMDTGVMTHDAGFGAGDGGSMCGNGTIEGTEECDDGNHFDLDGCDSSCHYELIDRMTALSISGSAGPSFCVHPENALGTKAITSLAIGQLNPPLQTDVKNGTVNVFMQFLDLRDLTGVTGTGFGLGVMDGKLDPAKGAWPASGNPIDWWFLVDPTTVDQGRPQGVLAGGALAAGALTAGPSTVELALTLGGTAANLTMRDAKVSAQISASPAPDAPPPPPSKLATGLVTFQTVTATGAGQGLCGDITVQSLAQIPVPKVLTMGTAKCTEGYSPCAGPVDATCNSLLDVLVGGCSVFGGAIVAINPTQPDVASGAAVQTLTVGANKKVTLPSNPDDDAYSAFLQFSANRAHFTGESCTTSGECQTGQTCTTAVCK